MFTNGGLTDMVEGSSWTYEKIDDYWRTDRKFHDNRLPYADKVEFVIVGPTTRATGRSPDPGNEEEYVMTPRLMLLPPARWSPRPSMAARSDRS